MDAMSTCPTCGCEIRTSAVVPVMLVRCPACSTEGAERDRRLTHAILGPER